MGKKTKLSTLVKRAKGGDQEALAQIVERFQPVMKNYGRRLGNDDAYYDLVIWIIGAVKGCQAVDKWDKDKTNRFPLYEKNHTNISGKV